MYTNLYYGLLHYCKGLSSSTSSTSDYTEDFHIQVRLRPKSELDKPTISFLIVTEVVGRNRWVVSSVEEYL